MSKPDQKSEGVSAAASAMWGGRFAAGPSAIMEEINASIGFDKRLFAHDIAGSKAHAAMLVQQGIIAPEDGEAIARGLDTVHKEMARGDFQFKRSLEDIHMNVEARLGELIGDAAEGLCEIYEMMHEVTGLGGEMMDRLSQHEIFRVLYIK